MVYKNRGTVIEIVYEDRVPYPPAAGGGVIRCVKPE